MFIVTFTIAGSAYAKSVYLVTDHHSSSFAAYNILPTGHVSFQKTITIPAVALGSSGVAIDSEPDTQPATLFITYENSNRIELIDPETMVNLGYTTAPGTGDLAGIDVDDINDIVYTVARYTSKLYAYDWNPATSTLTLKSGYPINLQNCSGAIGLALDEIKGILYVTDGNAGMVRGYDVNTWAETMNFAPSINPTGIAVDRRRDFIYTTSQDGHCAWAPYGYTLLCKYDLDTQVETSVDMGHGGMGIAVDEVTGYVYVTGGCTGDDLSVWTSDLISVDSTGDIGNPAGIAIGNVSYNPLNLSKDDGLEEDECVYTGADLTYTLCYDNTENPYDVSNVTITDDLPEDTTFVSATGGGTYNSTDHSVTWDIGTLSAGAGQQCVQLVVTVDAPPESVITNYCTIESTETGTTTEVLETEVCANQPPVADADGPYTGYEGSAIVFDASGSYDPDGDTLSYRWDFENDGTWDTPWSNSPTASHTWYDDHSGTAAVEVSDGSLTGTDTASVTVYNVPPTITGGLITVSADVVAVGTEITATADFTDPGTEDTHTALWEWDATTTSPGTVNETNGSGSVSGSHTYNTPGVYTVTLTVTDDDGGADTAEYEFIVVFDPSDGFVTGGGWIDSPPGAYYPDKSLTGKANFGFVSKYKKGAMTPTGQTEFQFKVADLNFHSTAYEWLVIAGFKAMYKGTGTINGAGNYGFILSAIDGQITGGGGTDKFRIMIWDAGGGMIYDNLPGGAMNADPATVLGGGSIVIHKK